MSDPRLLSDEQVRVLRLRAEGSVEGLCILSGALVADRAARVERQAADEALLRELSDLIAREDFHDLGHSRACEFAQLGADDCTCGLTPTLVKLRARLAGAQP